MSKSWDGRQSGIRNPLWKQGIRSFCKWPRRFRACGCPLLNPNQVRGRGGYLLERREFRRPTNRRRGRIQKSSSRAAPFQATFCNTRAVRARSCHRDRRSRAWRRGRRSRGRKGFSTQSNWRGAKRFDRSTCAG